VQRKVSNSVPTVIGDLTTEPTVNGVMFAPHSFDFSVTARFQLHTNCGRRCFIANNFYSFNPLPPSDAARKQKKIFLRIFSVQFRRNQKEISPSGNQKFYNLGIFQSLEFRISMKKFAQISLKLNVTPNVLGCNGLMSRAETLFFFGSYSNCVSKLAV